MKKSMIISTIAMIVVVVVALSTATYAWFTSAQQAKATTTITTATTSDWTVQKGTITGTAVTFQRATSDIELSATLAGGLWAPNQTTDIAVFPSSKTASQNVTVAATANFVQATQTLDFDDAKSSELANAVKPNVIRVINTKGGPKTLTLTVYIDLGQDPTEGQKYAATALTIYVATDSSNIYTNGYNKVTTPAAAENLAIGAGNHVDANGFAEKVYYNGSNDVGKKVVADSALAKAGFTVNNYVLSYTLNLGTVALNAGVNMVIYTWLDGYMANDQSIGASLGVTYAFSGTYEEASGSGSSGSQSQG